MRYFICSDIHGYYAILKKALERKGFDKKNPNHHLIICGDIFDRGKQARKLLQELLKLKKQGRLTIILGNHELLLEECLEQIRTGVGNGNYISTHHYLNGTMDTISQLTQFNINDIAYGVCSYTDIYKRLNKYRELYKGATYYKEIGDYIFVHGWFPHIKEYAKLEECDIDEWKEATWMNGMQEWYNGWKFPNKTVVCGHWHTSFGNFHYHNKGSGEFEEDSNFNPFIDNGIIALDACTAYSRKINIYVLDIK